MLLLLLLLIYSLSFKGSALFLAFPHNSFWPVKWFETVIHVLTCKKCTGIRQTLRARRNEKKRGRVPTGYQYFLPQHPRQLVPNNIQYMFLYTHNLIPTCTFNIIDNGKQAGHQPFTSPCLIRNPKSEVQLKLFIVSQVQ